MTSVKVICWGVPDLVSVETESGANCLVWGSLKLGGTQIPSLD